MVNAGGMYAAEIGRMAGVRVPGDPDVAPVPGHAAVPRARPSGRLPTLRDPDLLVYYREDGGGLVMGGYERQSAPAFLPDGTGGLDRDPARLQRPPARGRLGPLRGDHRELASGACRRWTRSRSRKLINGPEAFTPDNEFCLGETEVARASSSPPASAPTASPAPGGIGKVMAEWIAEGEPSLDLWQMDVRRFGAQYRSPVLHPRADQGDLRDLLRHPLPEPRAQRRAAAAGLAGQRLAPRARRRLRREVRLGAGQLVRVERGGGRRVAAPARLGRPALVAGDRRRAPRDPRGGVAIFDETSFAKMEIEGPGRGRAPRAAVRQPGRPRASGKITYTQMLNRRGGIECDFTVARLGEERFSIVTGTAFGNHDREWIRTPPARRTAASQVRDVDLAVGLLRDLGPAGARRAARR